MFKSGFVTIVGKPNVGKSTLLNTLIGHKIAITTPKKNTTRNQIKGIFNDANFQIIFIDTPGFLSKSSKLEEQMQTRIRDSLKGVDIILYLLPFWKILDDEYLNSIEFTKNTEAKKYILLTKIDKAVDQEDIVRKVIELDEKCIVDKIIPISSTKNKNIEHLINEIKKDLKEDIPYYDQEKFSEFSDAFYISETIREKVLMKLSNEIPHNIFVKTDQLSNRGSTIYIRAEIILSRENIKKIVIGKEGAMIKKIGSSARKELQLYFKKNIFLDLFVKVKKDWQEKESIVKLI